MIDHVTIRVPDLVAARAFYTLALELVERSPTFESDAFVEWNDFSIAQATPDRPATRRLHIGFQATDRSQVDRWWQAMREAGYPDLGPPGPRPEYTAGYYGAFIADPAGNSIEAVHHKPRRTDGTSIDHLWLRVRSLEAASRFYQTVAHIVGYQVRSRRPDRTTIFKDEDASVSLVPGDVSENVHIAFAAPDTTTVDAFHQAGIQAGYTSLGEPAERPEYHPGYYSGYLADPDLNNIEAVHHDRRW